MRSVAVLGGGSFGTAIANIIADNGHQVGVWLRDKTLVDQFQRSGENVKYLPGYPLNPKVQFTNDLKSLCTHAEIIFLAIPSKSFRSVLQQIKPYVSPDQMMISTAKGIEADSFMLMSQVIEQELGTTKVGVLSGPNLAVEIAQRKLTGTVIASNDKELNKTIQTLLSQPYFRVYANDDVFGVELGGALKNIYAIAAGMADALGMGENTKGMLITRSLAEMSRMAAKLGGNPSTFLGLSGVGDLMVTCSSPLSRNYQLGYLLGEGLTLDEANTKLNQTVEGVNTVRLVRNKAQELGLYMPLVSGMYAILFDGQDLKTVISDLMMGEHADDVEFSLR
ncbi:MAG: NAD(P)H-dependent glycerol-3-phosphate dehydrogenase [Pseudomonadales bacterium]|nr:NAD(P)H-dependent glycerol-3-phosphate dehydrogenase [Pseudomonadales bacterium]